MNLERYPLQNPEQIASPALLYFREHILANLDAVIRIAGGVERLRPHVKTHKTAALTQLQLARGIRKFKCATIAEAEMLARAGAKDVLLAYSVVGPNIARVVRFRCLYPDVALSVLADDAPAVELLAKECSAFNRNLGVLIDLDPGMHRTGVSMDEKAVELALYVAGQPGLTLRGLHCYDGNNRAPDFATRLETARQTLSVTRQLKSAIEGHGVAVPTLVMGGTPGFPCYATFDDTELSPGTAFLHDWGYLRAFPDLPFTPAALLLTRVISRPAADIFTLDLGSKGIAADPQGARGHIPAYPDAEPLLQNEEHWVFRAPDARPATQSEARPLPEVGAPLLVIPTHVCPTSALYSEAIVIDGDGTVADRWPITARNRSIGV